MSDWFGGGDEKEARHQEDIARQKEEVRQILNEFLAQLVPGSEEYNQLVSEGGRLVETSSSPLNEQQLVRELGQRLVSQQQSRVASGGPASALESRTNLASKGLREAAAFAPYEQDLFDAMTGGSAAIDTDAGRIFQDVTRRAVSPDEYYRSTFQPALDLLQERVKARAASRGILGSGLELEDLGRTGSELAIREGEAKEGFRRNALNDFLSGIFDRGQTLRNRQIGLEEALTNLQLGRETNLTNLLAEQTFRRGSDASALLEGQTGRAETLRDEAERDAANRSARLATLVGSVAAAPFTGGASLAALPGALSGGSSSSVPSLLAATQQPATSGQSTQLGGGLTRSPEKLGQLDPNELLDLLMRGR